MYFDRFLTWNKHIIELKSSLINKMNIIKAISRASWGADRETMLMLYKNMIRPKLSYGCELYADTAHSNMKKIIAEQNKCIKIATGAVLSDILRLNGGWRLPNNYSVFDVELYAI